MAQDLAGFGTIRPFKDAFVIRFSSDQLGLGDPQEIERQLDSFLNQVSAPYQIIFDLENKKHLNSTEIGKLIALGNRIREIGGQVALTNLNEVTRDLFTLLHLEKIFIDATDEANAIEQMSQDEE